MSLVIDDARYRAEDISIPELQAEVQALLALDMTNPSGRAHVAEAILRRHPTLSQNVAIQIAVLEGENVRRQTMLDIISWVLGGQLFFRLLQKAARQVPE